jgi:hypothetical protein
LNYHNHLQKVSGTITREAATPLQMKSPTIFVELFASIGSLDSERLSLLNHSSFSEKKEADGISRLICRREASERYLFKINSRAWRERYRKERKFRNKVLERSLFLKTGNMNKKRTKRALKYYGGFSFMGSSPSGPNLRLFCVSSRIASRRPS